MRLWTALLAGWVLAGGVQAIDLPGPEVIEDWRRHDQSQLRELTEPGVLRFPNGEVQWPGLASRGKEEIPIVADAPVLDGEPDDVAWSSALEVVPSAPHEPTYRLCHDGGHLYVWAQLPAVVAPMYRGELTAMDAGGAVDGIKDGRYGFHTGGDANPWWQVDLGAVTTLDRVLVYNRLDYPPGLHNADSLRVLLSTDGTEWHVVYENPGTFFGGIDEVGPLTVDLEAAQARFVRLQVPSETGVLYRLDEVEVYGVEAPDVNIALGRPASQSTLSMWSRGGPNGAHLLQWGEWTVDLDNAELRVNGEAWQAGSVAPSGDSFMVEFSLPLRHGSGSPPTTI